MSFRIAGTGMYVPPRVVTNDDLARIVDTNDEWIRQRVGVEERRICTDEWTSDLAENAARAALDNAGVAPDELDLILAATVSGETCSPSMAAMTQHRLGATCPAFDINAACSAFIFLLDTAAGFFARGKVHKVLVIGAERLSGVLDWTDRSTCIIFGDGAGAAVLTDDGDNYLDATLTVHGGDDVIKIPHYIGSSPFFNKEIESPYIHMQGQETFKYAVNAMTTDITTLLTRNNLTAEDLKFIVPHQANRRIIDFTAKKLKIAPEKFYVNIQKYGNTSSASVPIALDELNRGGRLQKGDLLLLCAFGAGLSNGACLIRW